MILNVSYNNRDSKDKIIEQVGRPFRFLEKIREGLYGSQRFLIMESSPEIEKLLNLDNNLNHCNIELRRKGIILRFRSILNTYGWVIPFDALEIYRYSSHYAIFAGEQYVKIRPAHREPMNHAFFKKLNGLKAAFLGRPDPQINT